jgi:hypothetical protein
MNSRPHSSNLIGSTLTGYGDNMSVVPNEPPEWSRAVDAAEELLVAMGALIATGTDVSRPLRSSLTSLDSRRIALLLVAVMDWSVTVAVIDVVVPMCCSDRHAMLVREILGRLPHTVATRLIPPIVRAELARADDHSYRRYAELLRHLGLKDDLAELVNRANKSGDSTLADVAQDFAV